MSAPDTVVNAETMQACVMKFLANQENQLSLLERQLTEQKEAAEARVVQALCKIASLEVDELGDVSTLADPSVVEQLISKRRALDHH